MLSLREKYTIFLMCNFNIQNVFRLIHTLGHKMTPKILFVFIMPAESLSVSRILSTYTIRITKLDIVYWTKTEWSEWHWWKSMTEMVMLNFSNYTFGLCLSPYISFLRWKTFFFLLSNVPWWLIHINLLFQIIIQEGIFDNQLEQGLRQIDRNKK